MRVQNIFDIALFDSGLTEAMIASTLSYKHGSNTKNNEPVKKHSPRKAFAPYPIHFSKEVNKAKARPLMTA